MLVAEEKCRLDFSFWYAASTLIYEKGLDIAEALNR